MTNIDKALVLRDIHPLWHTVLDEALLAGALAKLTGQDITPKAELILEALRYGTPDDFHTVILGQDPYPTVNEAQGLCFSVPRTITAPDSLKRIFDCLERSGLRKPGPNGDLRSWAVQGVLMLNTALTTRVGTRLAHASIWKGFVNDFLTKLCASRRATPMKFLLWGEAARAYAPLVKRHGHAALEWTHPSPLSDNKVALADRFKQCPHFEIVNEDLSANDKRNVNWDNKADVIAFTDGSCPLNGKLGARAGFAVALAGGSFGEIRDETILRGEIHKFEYKFIDDSMPERGIVPTAVAANPSNNRGEMLGIIHALLAAARGRVCGHLEIVTDSELCLKTLTEWLPARLKKKTERELKNFDLVMIAWHLLNAVRASAAAVTLTHINSHRPAPPPSAPARQHYLHYGNDLVDRHAESALTRGHAGVEVFKAPAIIRQLETC